MAPEHRPNFLHVLVAIVSAFIGAAGGGTLAASRVGLPENAPDSCPPCPECPAPLAEVVVETPVPTPAPVPPTDQPSGMVQ
jgi:hypothetical protein